MEKTQSLKMLFAKIAPAVIGMLAVVLTINANSAGCFIVHQPKAPSALEDFKKIR